jgi:hypothetical protein
MVMGFGFKKYMHIERFGTDEVEGIELGKCYIFPKLDGTNASLWWDNLNVAPLKAGSRNRELSLENDNAGFLQANGVAATSSLDDKSPCYQYRMFFLKYPTLRLYGEWLVPHTLQTYQENAWRKFWIFDVLNDETDQLLSYETYKPLLDEFGLDYIPPLAIITNGTADNFLRVMSSNQFFIKDGEGIGEGIVIKNYDYYNKFNRQVWAKMVNTDSKVQHSRSMGPPEMDNSLLEEQIVIQYITESLVNKVYDKIKTEQNGWQSRYIPRLLETVFHDLIVEEMWQILKEFKNPFINFKTLKALSINRIKQLKPEIF